MPCGVWRSGLGRLARLRVVEDASRSTLALVEPIAVAVHLEDVDVVGERSRSAPVSRSEPNAPVHSSNGRLFGLLDHGAEKLSDARFAKRHFYRKAPLFDRFLTFHVHTEQPETARH